MNTLSQTKLRRKRHHRFPSPRSGSCPCQRTRLAAGREESGRTRERLASKRSLQMNARLSPFSTRRKLYSAATSSWAGMASDAASTSTSTTPSPTSSRVFAQRSILGLCLSRIAGTPQWGVRLAIICECLPYTGTIKASQTGLVFRRAVSGEFLAGERRLICCRGMPSAPAR
jgi:hypothetical protein